MGMVGCEDVCKFFDGFDLLLGLDCGVGHSGEGGGYVVAKGGLVERGVLVVKCKLIIYNR
jgi:hypothetical protein